MFMSPQIIEQIYTEWITRMRLNPQNFIARAQTDTMSVQVVAKDQAKQFVTIGRELGLIPKEN
jgi:hypothetical protein